MSFGAIHILLNMYHFLLQQTHIVLNSLNQVVLSLQLLESFAICILLCLQLLLGLNASCLQDSGYQIRYLSLPYNMLHVNNLTCGTPALSPVTLIWKRAQQQALLLTAQCHGEAACLQPECLAATTHSLLQCCAR